MKRSLIESKDENTPGVIISLIPILFLIGSMVLNLVIDVVDVPIEIILFVSTVVAGLVAFFGLKVPYKNIEKGVLKSIGLSMHANLMMLLIGALIGMWIASGIVPMLIYYGLMIISPK